MNDIPLGRFIEGNAVLIVVRHASETTKSEVTYFSNRCESLKREIEDNLMSRRA